MKTKTFKIGEYAKGGVITVEIHGKILIIIGKDWDFSQGSKRGSSQKNAKEFTRGSLIVTDEGSYHKVQKFLLDLTSYGWTDTIMEWIETKVELKV